MKGSSWPVACGSWKGVRGSIDGSVAQSLAAWSVLVCGISFYAESPSEHRGIAWATPTRMLLGKFLISLSRDPKTPPWCCDRSNRSIASLTARQPIPTQTDGRGGWTRVRSRSGRTQQRQLKKEAARAIREQISAKPRHAPDQSID